MFLVLVNPLRLYSCSPAQGQLNNSRAHSVILGIIFHQYSQRRMQLLVASARLLVQSSLTLDFFLDNIWVL
jgi:hypothetical protein